jgi:sec-independent protein translocase protein TatB
MFDVGFWEMVLVGVVALLVFGPERLPRVVRETGLWVRKARSVVATAKREIDQELQLQELQESLRKGKKAITSLPLDEPVEWLERAGKGGDAATAPKDSAETDRTPDGH